MMSNGCAVICGKMSGITVYDFDNIEYYNKIVHEFPEIKEYLTVKTKNGVHVYFKYNADVLTSTNCAIDCENAVDIRNDNSIVFSPPTRYNLLDGSKVIYTVVGGELCDIPHFLLHKLKQFNKNELQNKSMKQRKSVIENDETDNENSDNESIKINDNDDEFDKLLKCIGSTKCKEGQNKDWVAVGQAFKK
jgi:hypothetical protein